MQSLSHLLAFQLPARMAIGSYWEILGAIGCFAGGDLAIGSYWELLAACARAMLPRRIARTQLCSINKKTKHKIGSFVNRKSFTFLARSIAGALQAVGVCCGQSAYTHRCVLFWHLFSAVVFLFVDNTTLNSMGQ